MRLRTALNDYKRNRGARFPEECPTANGAFSAHGDRLVYVDPRGRLRDYSSSLSGLYGIDRSRFGIETDDGTRWFDELDAVRQHYYRETNVVETEYDAGAYTVHQYDLTLGRAHVTHVELRGAIPADAHLTAFLTFAPEGRETRVGRLIHESSGPNGTKAVEVFHRNEHDYVTASTGLTDVRGQIPERFDEMLSEDSFEFPREAVLNRYEDTHLSGDIVVSAPFEREGRAARTTFVTQLSDHGELTREQALSDLRDCALSHATADDLREAGRMRAEVYVPDGAPNARVVRSDLRALSLLTAPTGAHIAGPEFDPFYAHSGGYGYTWFRDDAEVAANLLESDDLLDLDVDDQLQRSVGFLCDTQQEDGSWPHRVWAVDGSLAPGWAHGRVEGNEGDEYQADQTASVTTYLATYLRKRGTRLRSAERREIRGAIDRAVTAMDETLADDGLPIRCQNAWENMGGRFTHTAATFLEAYAAVARAPVDDKLGDHAEVQAGAVVAGLDELWIEDVGHYALRLDGSHLDDRFDSSTLALVDAFDEYSHVEELTEESLDRLRDHVGETLDGLYRSPEGTPVAGLVRFEDDTWRRGDQEPPKVWSVSTAWGANAAVKLATLLDRFGFDGEAFLVRAENLYELLLPEGPFATEAGYLAEQIFDDGTFDSATPIGWSHSLRLVTTALLREVDALPVSTSAPSGPEEWPRWTTGEKYGVGTVADHGDEDPSRVWFTLTEGALTEVRFPRVDLMNLRTLDFLVVDAEEGSDYTARTYNETRRDDAAETIGRRAEIVEEDALVFRHIIAERGDGRGHEWELTLEYAADPQHDALVVDVSFEALDGNEYQLFSVADTSLTNTGAKDRGMRLGKPGSYHLVARDAGAYDVGDPVLTDEEGEPYSVALALAAANRFEWATVGVAGSEYLHGLFSGGDQPESRSRVDDENIVLVGRVGVGTELDETLALGFGENADTAAALGEAAGALTRGYETVRAAYVDSWERFLEPKALPECVVADDDLRAQYKSCLMGLRAVEDKTFLGAGIASPSVPWGEAVSSEEAKGYGYNFVWARDLYQVFTVFEAVGDLETAEAALSYVYNYQQDDHGFIPQNSYLDGRTRWGGEQIDNISFPQVMAYQLFEDGLGFEEADYDYRNVKRSADYVARNGPATAQERWEEEAGYSPSSIAAEIAGLVCAAAIARDEGRTDDALVWLSLADDWTANVESWTATETGTELHTHTPYYVRVTRDGDPEAGHLRTLANNGPTLDEREIIDGGFLELTRLGIKPWDDEVIRNSLVEVDEAIRVDTPYGPAFYRYNGDGYGEQGGDEEGAPWSIETKGQGRLWPIFTGERGEYELLAGTEDGPLAPENLLRTMAAFANSGRMLAEQVWDRDQETEYNWEFGEGTGSATPLAWSMAQFVRLAHGIDAGRPVETPAAVEKRYLETERPDGPSIRVDTDFRGDTLHVTGKTDAAIVAVRTDEGTALVEPEDGTYEATVDISHGENQIIVAAATDIDLETAGTTVKRFTL
ncbi:glycoside hydrolase family 15 protein [Haloprofundus halobius]|uniref:glycoside hydrolase family 15 protein n=1 Tax=Haloprofundus halobius TaxID=2876194 RepID=UPI001CCA4FC4|nr:glycoside hydrolase family 15 protein [Haloprofundus halobius]